MAKFDIEIHTFEIDGQLYEMSPLRGKDIKKFFRLIKLMQNSNTGAMQKVRESEDEEELEEIKEDLEFDLEPEAFELAHELITETLEYTNDVTDRDKLEQFVTRNLTELLPEFMQANMKNAQE